MTESSPGSGFAGDIIRGQTSNPASENYYWWVPPPHRPAFVIESFDNKGTRHIEPSTSMLPASEIICDFCNVLVKIRPVPVVGGDPPHGWALCPDCFTHKVLMTVENVARQDGIVLQNVGGEKYGG